ncbi:MAG: uroporphyrinogen-III synthase [Bacteroidota bacterium]|nr:uroporphyrinogen-III synthase [Bacteroidota bacterium]
MAIKSILISQPEPTNDRSPYFDLSGKYSLQIDFRSFIEVVGVSLKEFRKQKVNLLEHSAVILTSKTAVDNYFRLAEEMRINIPTSMKFFCITETIALYLQKYITYRKRKIFFGERKLEDMMEVLMKNRNERFLLPVADVHKPTVANTLKKKKFSFTKAVMFKTVSSDLSDLRDVNYDILVFFSPSGINSLLENFPDFVQNSTKIATFGPTTTEAVTQSGLRSDITAPTKEAPSMSRAIELFIKSEKN